MSNEITNYIDRKLAEDPTYNSGYVKGWEDAIKYVIDISKDMKYNGEYWDRETLDELEQRIV